MKLSAALIIGIVLALLVTFGEPSEKKLTRGRRNSPNVMLINEDFNERETNVDKLGSRSKRHSYPNNDNKENQPPQENDQSHWVSAYSPFGSDPWSGVQNFDVRGPFPYFL